MGIHELSHYSNNRPEQLQDAFYFYGKLYSDMKERMFDAQREGKIDFRNPGGKETAGNERIGEGVWQRISTREFHISPPNATLDIGALNTIAYGVALESDHVHPGFYFKSGRLLPKDGIVFPEVVVEETLAEVEKQMVINVTDDPYLRGEEFANEEIRRYAISPDVTSRTRFVQRTKIIVHPSKHIAQLLSTQHISSLIINDRSCPRRGVGLHPDAMTRFRIAMDKKDINTLPPGQTDWLEDILG